MEKIIGYMFFKDGFLWKNRDEDRINENHEKDIVKVYSSPFTVFNDYYNQFLNENGDFNHVVEVSFFSRHIFHLEEFPCIKFHIERKNVKIEKELSFKNIIEYDINEYLNAGQNSLIITYKNSDTLSEYEKVVSNKNNFSYSLLDDNSSIITNGNKSKFSIKGKYSTFLSCGDNTEVISKGIYNRIVSLGNNNDIFSFGGLTEIVSSGNNSIISIYGNNTLVNCTGKNNNIFIYGKTCNFRAVKDTNLFFYWIDKNNNKKMNFLKIGESTDYKENYLYRFSNGIFSKAGVLCS